MILIIIIQFKVFLFGMAKANQSKVIACRFRNLALSPSDTHNSSANLLFFIILIIAKYACILYYYTNNAY